MEWWIISIHFKVTQTHWINLQQRFLSFWSHWTQLLIRKTAKVRHICRFGSVKLGGVLSGFTFAALFWSHSDDTYTSRICGHGRPKHNIRVNTCCKLPIFSRITKSWKKWFPRVPHCMCLFFKDIIWSRQSIYYTVLKRGDFCSGVKPVYSSNPSPQEVCRTHLEQSRSGQTAVLQFPYQSVKSLGP